jgi:hypothetical protein
MCDEIVFRKKKKKVVNWHAIQVFIMNIVRNKSDLSLNKMVFRIAILLFQTSQKSDIL